MSEKAVSKWKVLSFSVVPAAIEADCGAGL